MTLLALDLGSKLGWAVRRSSGVFSGTESFKPGRFEGGGMQWVRFDRWLVDACAESRVTQITFEEVVGFGVHKGATQSAMVFGGFLSTLQRHCEAARIPYFGMSVGTVKKHTTGKGNANKADMIAAIRALGHNPKDDNEADAIAILLCAESQMQRRAA